MQKMARDRAPGAGWPEHRPGKLLLVTRDVDGGLGRHFVDLAEGMAARGWEVHCIRAEQVSGHVTDHSARLDRLPGVTVHPIPLARSIGPGDLRSFLTFRKVVKQYGPFDIAHGHGAKGGVLVRLASGRSSASVYTPHGLITLDGSLPAPRRLAYGLIERLLNIWLTNLVITVSQAEREEAIRLGTPPERCIVVPNGIKALDFIGRNEARRKMGLCARDEVALFVGRFVYAKSPERFIRAMSVVARKRQNFKAVLVGSGEEKVALSKMCLRLGARRHFVFFETKNAASFMRVADLLVVPSRYEGLSYTMIEALAAGLPIVTFNVSGSEVLVDHQRNGFVVPQGDEDALATRVEELLEYSDLRARMAKASRERFGQFSLQSMILRTASAYDDAMWLSHRRDKKLFRPPALSS